jgi:hypothetical protein
MAAPVFAGTTRLSGNVFFGYNSAIAIPGVELTAAAARLDVTGGLSAAQIADIRISAKNVPNAESRTLKDAEIRRLGFDAHVTGALDTPTIDSTLEVEDARLPSASLSHLDASFKAAPTGSIANASTLLQLAADAKVRGLSSQIQLWRRRSAARRALRCAAPVRSRASLIFRPWRSSRRPCRPRSSVPETRGLLPVSHRIADRPSHRSADLPPMQAMLKELPTPYSTK